MGEEMTELVEDDTTLRRSARRAKRHVDWVRTSGARRVFEEKDAYPIARLVDHGRRVWWRRSNPGAAATTTPLYIVGVQRSGTNMLIRGLERAPEVEVHSENSRAAFDRYQLRSDVEIAQIIRRSRHRFVLFKPLCDSHRLGTLLDDVYPDQPGRALWVYRDFEARARSAVAKFGDANRVVLTRIAAGQDLDRWQAQGLSCERLEELSRLEPHKLDPTSAAALFWYLRNSLFFDLGFHGRSDVRLLSYERVTAQPVEEIEAAARFLGLTWDDRMAAKVAPRAPSDRRFDCDPRVTAVCVDLYERLATAAAEQESAMCPNTQMP